MIRYFNSKTLAFEVLKTYMEIQVNEEGEETEVEVIESIGDRKPYTDEEICAIFKQLRKGDKELKADENGYAIVVDRPQTEVLKEKAEIELAEIQKWFTDNDWKVNKIVIGEWEETDERWIKYLSERSIKRARQDELNIILGK